MRRLAIAFLLALVPVSASAYDGSWLAGLGDPNITGYGSAEDLAE